MRTILTLRGLTLKGRNRIREHGIDWELLDCKDSRFLLVSGEEMRWIAARDDRDFEIIDSRTEK